MERPSDPNSTLYPLARFGTDVITYELAYRTDLSDGWSAHSAPLAQHMIDLFGSTNLAKTTNLGVRTDMMTWRAYS
jgi:hypothetical protein